MPFEHLAQYEADGSASEMRTPEIFTLNLYTATHVDKASSFFLQDPTSEKSKVSDSFLAARKATLSSVFK